MNNNKWNFAGSHWWKFDFHTHTPKSFDCARKDHMAEGWLLDFMKAEIDCVVITDHNSGEWIDELKTTYAEMEKNPSEGFREMFLFPGVEITVQNGIHILAILDPEKKGADIASILGACGFSGENGESKDCTSKSVTEVFAEIVKYGGIAIPAHVDEAKGLFQQIDDGNTLEKIFRDENVFCAEAVASTYKFPKKHDKMKSHWSRVVGSDAHKPEEAGRRYTWVKMGTPTIEGLKLALMDGNDFSLIRFDETQSDPNTHATFVIKSIEIKDAQYCGNGIPLQAEFNPWLNCIIGGRGSGKSTIIEFLRIVMRREEEIKLLGEDSELYKIFDKFRHIPAGRGDKGVLREETQVIVECLLDGTTFFVQWANDGSLVSIQKKLTDGTLETSPGEIPVRFPVRIYSQKQIFEIASNPESLLKIIDEAPEVGYREWKNTHDQICAQYRSLKSKSREMEVQIKEESILSGELDDVKRKLALFEQGENAHIRKDYQVKRSQEKEIDLFIESLQETNRLLQQVKIEPITPRIELFSESEDAIAVSKLIEEYINKAQTMNAELSQLKIKVDALSLDFSGKVDATGWKKNLHSTIELLNKLNEKLKAEGVDNPDEYGLFIQRKYLLENRLSVINGLKITMDSLDKQAAAEIEKLWQHRRKLTIQRKQFISEVLANNSFIKIEINECGDTKSIERIFRDLIGCEEGFQNDIITPDQKNGILSPLFESFSYDKLTKIKQGLKQMKYGSIETPLFDKRFINRLQKVTEEMLDSLDLWFPADEIIISYNREQAKSNFVSIEQGSPGQKTAAILAFLLSYGKEPIILDQPEDDLDNHLIFDLIVKQVRENKKQRQIIIVTHNPNIVVNGDAEMVYSLDFKNGQSCIIKEGCLQEKEIRLEICRSMEGGIIAFEQRYKRINIGEIYV
ncbi:MAG: PHP-associated domain-containing protein [Candidatus Desantisbacteria bacterium]